MLLVNSSATVQAATTSSTVNNRLFGQDRYQTSVAIAEAYNNGSLQNVILASGNDFPDALSASILSKKLNAPILLIDSTANVSSKIFDYINTHVSNTGTVYIIGGTAIINTDFETKLSSMGFINIKRLAGTDRYDTDMLIVNEAKVPYGTPVFIASGENFPDALSVSSFSGSKQYPTLLVGSYYLSDTTKSYIESNKPSVVYIVGGVYAVSQDVQNQIQTLDPGVTINRLSGNDRFETTAAVLNKFMGSPQTIYLANGNNFPDALAGGALATKSGSPILLVDNQSTQLPSAIEAYLRILYNAGIQPNITALGGTNAVPDIIIKQAENALAGKPPIITNVSMGNTLGNIQNGGDAAILGDWIYYPQVPILGAFYKMKVDGTQKTKITNDSPLYINVTGDWLYYRNNLDRKIYKIKTDGSERTKLTDDSGLYLTLSGNWIYYINESDHYTIWKISTDGQQRLQLNKQYSSCLNVVGDSIYYINNNDQGKIYMMNSDGSGNIKISDNVRPWFMVVTNDTIYYINSGTVNDHNLYKMSTDGTAQTQIVDDYISYFNLDGDSIYYTSGKNNNNLYKIKVDGSGQTRLNSSYTTSPNIVGNWIYYYSKERDSVYWIHTDGSGERSVK